MKQNKLAGEDGGSITPFFTTYIPNKGGKFKINLHGPIIAADQFVWAVQALEAAGEDDMVEISLQSPGGSLDVADYFIHAMRKTEGHIHIVATGNCSSAATLILLQADSFELSENFNSLIHNGSIGSMGNFNEYRAQVSFYPQWMEKALRNGYEGFLTEKEMNDLMDGKDIILNATQWVEHYNQRNEYFKKKQAKLDKAAKKNSRKLTHQPDKLPFCDPIF
jgi:ATP-dependent protease ClpP protease subunit